jgi:deazaflavin-dependent oxidoreductase (nitroreductase family)
MGDSGSPALRGTWVGTILRFWNPVMKRLLRSPFHRPWSRWFLLISWTGRKSGKPYSTPVSYAAEDGGFLVTTGDRWWKNLVGGGTVDLWVRGRRRRATAAPILDEESSLAGHRRIFRGRPLFSLLARLPLGAGGMPTDEAIREALRQGRVLVRIERPPAA